MKVIAGLGNPGREYENTKHNVGFRVIDKIAEKNGISVNKFKYKAFIGEGTICGEKVMLVKPQTFMNLSGESIKQILMFYKVPAKDFMVIYDDTSLPLASIRIRQKGSAGGHNGMKNIIQLLGGDTFDRIKVGIGEKPSGWDLADYVLSRFSKDDEPLIEQGIDKAAKAAELILKNGAEKAMNEMNRIER